MTDIVKLKNPCSWLVELRSPFLYCKHNICIKQVIRNPWLHSANKHNITSSTLLQSSNLVGTRNAKIACCIPQFLNDHVVSTPHLVKVSAITGFSGGNLQIAKKNITVLSNTIYVCSNRRCKIDIPIKLQKIMKYDSVNRSWKQKEDNAKQVQ